MDALGLSLPAVVAARYKHMMPEDAAIWTRYLEGGVQLPERVWYDVRVGGGVELPTGRPEWMAKMVDYTWRKRIDVVGQVGPDFWIIEAKPGAGIVALGQVIYYALAFAAEYAPPGRVVPMVVTDFADMDVVPVFDAVGIVVAEVGLPGATAGG